MQRLLPLFLGFTFSFLISAAQAQHIPSGDTLTHQIIAADSAFFLGYNTCNMDLCRRYLDPCIEFYHDKGGVTLGSPALIGTIERNICGYHKPVAERAKIRREVVPGSLHVFPMAGYGAILVGEHKFFGTPPGKPEEYGGTARFTHLWQLTKDGWKMTRILSYDHH